MTDQNGSAGAGNPAGDAGQQQQQAAPWYGAEAGEGIKGFVELKGWDSPVKAIESYQNLEKLLGADKAGRAVVWPKDDNDAEGWKAIHARLGVPENPEGYKLAVPEGQSDAFAKHMAPILHKLGVPAKAAEALATAFNEFGTSQAKAANDAAAAKVTEQMAALKQEWGGAYEERAALGQNFVKSIATEMGWDEQATAKNLEMLEAAWGSASLMKFMAAAGAMLGEDRFREGGQSPSLSMTPAAAQARIDQLMQDRAWLDRWVAGDAAAVAEKDRLDKAVLAGKQAA